MKKTPAAVKPLPRAPRVDCREVAYSETALRLMEEATGQHYSRGRPVIKPVTVATDAE